MVPGALGRVGDLAADPRDLAAHPLDALPRLAPDEARAVLDRDQALLDRVLDRADHALELVPQLDRLLDDRLERLVLGHLAELGQELADRGDAVVGALRTGGRGLFHRLARQLGLRDRLRADRL